MAVGRGRSKWHCPSSRPFYGGHSLLLPDLLVLISDLKGLQRAQRQPAHDQHSRSYALRQQSFDSEQMQHSRPDQNRLSETSLEFRTLHRLHQQTVQRQSGAGLAHHVTEHVPLAVDRVSSAGLRTQSLLRKDMQKYLDMSAEDRDMAAVKTAYVVDAPHRMIGANEPPANATIYEVNEAIASQRADGYTNGAHLTAYERLGNVSTAPVRDIMIPPPRCLRRCLKRSPRRSLCLRRCFPLRHCPRTMPAKRLRRCRELRQARLKRIRERKKRQQKKRQQQTQQTSSNVQFNI